MAEGQGGQETQTSIAVLLAIAAILAAAIGARAAALGDEGSNTWHSAVRGDIKKDAAIVEDVRFVYEEEAPQALAAAEASIRSSEYRHAAEGSPEPVRTFLEDDAAAQARLIQTFRQSSTLVKDPRYSGEGDSYDVARRLADVRNENPELVALDPDATFEEGSDLARKGSFLLLAAIPVGFAFLCGALAHGFPRWRRILLPAGFCAAGAGLIAALAIEVAL